MEPRLHRRAAAALARRCSEMSRRCPTSRRTRRAGLAHALTPGFAFSGDSGGPMDFNGGTPAELFRVYVATDEDCVNIVYRGAVVGSPAYAPRTTGPLQLPGDTDLLAFARGDTIDHGVEGETLMLDGTESVDERGGSQDHREHHNRLDRRCPRRDDCGQGRPARHRLAGGRVLLDRRSRRRRAQADDQASGSGRTDSDPVSRDRAAAGRLPVRPRDALRQGDPAGRHRVEPSLCKRALPQGPADLGRAHDSVVLRDAARCLAVRPRRAGVRDPVEQDRRSVAPARLPGDRERRRRCSRSTPAAGTTASAATTTRSSSVPQMAWSTPAALKVSKPTFSVVKGGR